MLVNSAFYPDFATWALVLAGNTCRSPLHIHLTYTFSALAAYTFGVLMGTLASEGVVSWEQELEHSQQSTSLDSIVEIQAIQWKRQMQLQGLKKDASRELAVHLVPDLSEALRYALAVPSHTTHTPQSDTRHVPACAVLHRRQVRFM